MNVLIVGSGGREHALGWKAVQSPRLEKLFFAPGNAGTAKLGQNVPIFAEDIHKIKEFAYNSDIDLVLVGPEVPLSLGLVDMLEQDKGKNKIGKRLRVFGPSQAAAQLESSKAFAKDFMNRHHIPTGRSATFESLEPALAYLRRASLPPAEFPPVIKASGLAAGKGVIIPATVAEAEAALRAMLVDQEFGEAGRQVILEERLMGTEVSLLAFTDGKVVRPMPPAQDHKRLLDNDQGPNTGGMGAYAPAPVCPPILVDEIVRTVLQPTIDGLRSEGIPFIGVLYAGLMLTAQGVRVLEFNCRFGDPETQPLMMLLESDLLDIAEACVDGRLAEVDVRWKQGAAACVVIASENYPGKILSGRVISGLEEQPDPLEIGTRPVIFHAGTRFEAEQVVTAGGRVLGVTGWGEDLKTALAQSYQAAGQVHFDGMQYRKDIGWQALAEQPKAGPGTYAASGVNIDAGNRAVSLMSQAVRSTYGPEVLLGIGAFGGLYDAAGLKAMANPVLVGSTDGVGTKVKLAAQAGCYGSIGQDIVNHCINDILVQGAHPLFFLDYFATSRLSPEVVAEIVTGISLACREAGCALLGGETAEMPGVYVAGEFDVAGTIVGVVERAEILPHLDAKGTSTLAAGDVLVGLRSSGPHTNGYSLIRKIFEDVPLENTFPELGATLGEMLLAPHRSYLGLLKPLLARKELGIKALAHLTGGGFIENIPRVLPLGLGANIHLGSWPIPPLFRLIQQRGQIATDEMYRVFNMGVGMVVIAAAESVQALLQALPEQAWIIGELAPGERKVTLLHE